MKQQNEEQKLGASYLVSFSEAVEELTNSAIQYATLVERYDLKNKNGAADLNDTNTVAEQARVTKYWIHRTYIQYNSITEATTKKQQKTSKTKQIYEELDTQTILNKQKVLEYTQAINDALSSEIIQTLLQTSAHILNDIYPNS